MAFALGVADAVLDHVRRIESGAFWQSYNPARGEAQLALVLIGVIAVIVAACLTDYEKRIERLEKDRRF